MKPHIWLNTERPHLKNRWCCHGVLPGSPRLGANPMTWLSLDHRRRGLGDSPVAAYRDWQARNRRRRDEMILIDRLAIPGPLARLVNAALRRT